MSSNKRYFFWGVGLAVTVADVLSAPSTAPSFVIGNVLLPIPKKRSALLAFFRTTHYGSSPTPAKKKRSPKGSVFF